MKYRRESSNAEVNSPTAPQMRSIFIAHHPYGNVPLNFSGNTVSGLNKLIYYQTTNYDHECKRNEENFFRGFLEQMMPSILSLC